MNDFKNLIFKLDKTIDEEIKIDSNLKLLEDSLKSWASVIENYKIKKSQYELDEYLPFIEFTDKQ